MSRTATTTVLVTDAARGSAVASIRSLAAAGYRVIAADADPGAPGLVSRFASDRLVYPSPSNDVDAFVDCLREAVKRLSVDVVFPVTDAVMLALEAHRPSLESICRIPWIDPDAALQVRDKHRTFALAEQVGVPYPATAIVRTTDQALDAAGKFDWPVVLKPTMSQTLDGRQLQAWTVRYAFDENDLRRKMIEFESTSAVLLQEYFDGAGVGVEVLSDRGNIRCAFQHRRLREVPLTGGVGSFRRSEALDPILFDYTQRLIRQLKWTGLAMVEFKQNASGAVRLMEINGRVWGSLPVAIAAGVDFPSQLCKQLLQDNRSHSIACEEPITLQRPRPGIPDQPPYRIGVHVHHLQKELSWIVRVLRGTPFHPVKQLPKRSDAMRAIADLLDPRNRFDILTWSDLRPGIRLIRNLCTPKVHSQKSQEKEPTS